MSDRKFILAVGKLGPKHSVPMMRVQILCSSIRSLALVAKVRLRAK